IQPGHRAGHQADLPCHILSHTLLGMSWMCLRQRVFIPFKLVAKRDEINTPLLRLAKGSVAEILARACTALGVALFDGINVVFFSNGYIFGFPGIIQHINSESSNDFVSIWSGQGCTVIAPALWYTHFFASG